MIVDLEPAKTILKKKTSVALPLNLQREAYEVARKHDISLSEYVTRLLRADLAERKKSQGDSSLKENS